MLIWITGISGSGKTTLGRRLYERMRPTYSNLVYLDGDEFRAACGSDLGHTLEDRDENAVRMTGICKLLCEQGLHVICGANLTSQRFRDWCRSEIPDYYEVFVDVPFAVLIERDDKGLYKAAMAAQKSDVVGVDIPFIPPRDPFLTIDNSEDRESFDELVDQIVSAVGIKLDDRPLNG